MAQLFLLVVMTTLPNLKKQRGGFRGRITFVYNRYKEFPDNEVSVFALEECLSDIRDKLKQIEELNLSIFVESDDPEVINQEIECSALCKCEIREIIAEVSTRK